MAQSLQELGTVCALSPSEERDLRHVYVKEIQKQSCEHARQSLLSHATRPMLFNFGCIGL